MDWKTVTKILRLRRPDATTTTTGSDDPAIQKLKLKSQKALFSQPLDRDLNRQGHNASELESIIAHLFASIAAIKASYAQLQLAQSPYDPDSIQSADQSIVSDLQRISELKQSYSKAQTFAPSKSPLDAHIEEQKNLIKTFQITIKKLESELQSKDSEIIPLQSKLAEIESKLYPNKSSLVRLSNLHFSALNPGHFLIALRFAAKSIRSFVKIMVREMDSAGWDLNAAATAIHGIRLKPEHLIFAFESFVCGRMFEHFHRRDFSFEFLEHRSKWNQRQFFDEFHELKFLKAQNVIDRKVEFGKFCRGKYSRLVHPRMDAAFRGSSGFVDGFHEMAKRVWLLHCLFFSFGSSEVDGSVFQARRGSRFSEVYMESVADEDPIRGSPTVGFMVAPGFRVGSTVIQCKVYLS